MDSRARNGRLLTVVLSFLLLAGFLAAPPDASGQHTSPRRFSAWVHEDVGDWASSWDAGRVLGSAGVVAALVPISFADEAISRTTSRWDTGVLGGFLDGANELGGPRGVLIPAGVFALSLVADDSKLQDAAFTSLQSVVYSNLITFTLKWTLGRSRPDAGRGSRDFHPFSGASSFPSGHATTAFAIVVPWVMYYPNVATYGFLVVATGTAVARLQRQRHWLTDVLAGAANGIAMSYWLSRHHKGDDVESGELTPLLSIAAAGMTFRVRF